MHHMGIDISQLLVVERLWECSDNRESQLLPQCDRTFIRADDEIELHCLKARLLCFNQAMLPHGFADAFPMRNRTHHERCVGDVRSEVALVRNQLVESDDASLEFGHEGRDFGIQPIDVGIFATGGRGENIRVAGGDNGMED